MPLLQHECIYCYLLWDESLNSLPAVSASNLWENFKLILAKTNPKPSFCYKVDLIKLLRNLTFNSYVVPGGNNFSQNQIDSLAASLRTYLCTLCFSEKCVLFICIKCTCQLSFLLCLACIYPLHSPTSLSWNENYSHDLWQCVWSLNWIESKIAVFQEPPNIKNPSTFVCVTFFRLLTHYFAFKLG